MKKYLMVLLVLVISASFWACNKQDEKTTGTIDIGSSTEVSNEEQVMIDGSAIVMEMEDYPRVDGSTATLPLSAALYRLSTGASEAEADANIIHNKTNIAYTNLIFNNTDLVLGYEPSDDVYELMKTEHVELEIKAIGKDALVFMANDNNKVTSLTKDQLIGIYSGAIQNWSEVGGADSEIMAFQRSEGSGSQTLMEKLVMQHTPMEEVPITLTVTSMGEIINRVASYNNEANALGYSVYFYAEFMYQQPELRFMDVDGIKPSNETIKSGHYPLINDFYAAIRKDTPKDSKEYLLFQWLTEKEGQKLVEHVGYVGNGVE